MAPGTHIIHLKPTQGKSISNSGYSSTLITPCSFSESCQCLNFKVWLVIKKNCCIRRDISVIYNGIALPRLIIGRYQDWVCKWISLGCAVCISAKEKYRIQNTLCTIHKSINSVATDENHVQSTRDSFEYTTNRITNGYTINFKVWIKMARWPLTCKLISTRK